MIAVQVTSGKQGEDEIPDWLRALRKRNDSNVINHVTHQLRYHIIPSDGLQEWFVLSVKRGSEIMLRDMFDHLLVSAYLPMQKLRIVKRRSHRQRKVDVPLFSGYLFVCLPMSARVRSALGMLHEIKGIIGHGSMPAAVRDSSILDLQLREKAGRFDWSRRHPFEVGHRVLFPFPGIDAMEGRIKRFIGRRKAVVAPIGFQGQISTIVPLDEIEAV